MNYAIEILLDQRQLLIDEIEWENKESLEFKEIKQRLKEVNDALDKLKYDDFESLPTMNPD